MTRYILDADVFIQAKNFHYQMGFCDGFWTWIESAHAAGRVNSINKVKTELLRGSRSDDARTWAENAPRGLFLEDENDAELMGFYAAAISSVEAVARYSRPAKNVFADVNRADAFLVAAGRRYGATVVTHEVSSPESVRRVPLPDAAGLIGVQTITLFRLLSLHAECPNFTYKDA